MAQALMALNLLIVDDEENIVRSLARSVRDLFTVFTANSGADALEILAQEDIDVILTDQRMPGMTGIELLTAAKTIRPSAVGIIITAYTDVEALAVAVNLNNVHGYVAKPWNIQQLRQMLLEAALQQSENFIQQVLDTTPSGIYIYDATVRRNIYANHSVTSILGYSSDAILQMDEVLLRHLAHGNDIKKVDDHLTHVADMAEGVFELQCRLKRANGEWCWLQVWERVLVRGNIGKAKLVLGAFHEITEHKKIEQVLQEALAAEKELSELKIRFVSMASHEFRTPLATILATTDTLSAYRNRMSNDQIEQKLTNIKEQVAHLEDIMDDVLRLAQMQARQVEFKPAFANVDRMCRSIIDGFQEHPDIHHRFVYTCNGLILDAKLDKNLVQQILSNLISNAIKYSPADSSVLVHLDFAPEAVTVSVSDQGIGIPESDLKHLFEPFHRGKNVGTISGTGLGLVIAKEAVELHGGAISVESKVDVGSVFTIRIPITVKTGNNTADNR